MGLSWEKGTLDNAMLKKNLMQLESELSPFRSLTGLTEQTQVSTRTAWRAIKNVCLWPCKIRQVQATDDGDYRGTQIFNFLLKKLDSI